MLKLNERGWGYGFLIFFSALFLLLLIGVSIRISTLSNNKKKDKAPVPLEQTKDYSRMYQLLENKLRDAGEYYVLDNESFLYDSNGNSKLTLSFLKSHGYIDDILDPIYNTPCDGFIIIRSKNNIKAYIKCSEYKTADYDSWS